MRRRRNIEQGYYADGVFHPIRASSDYNPKRGGDISGSSAADLAAYARRRRKKNPGTKAERAVRAQKKAVERRVAVALAKYLKQMNPAMKTAGAKVQRLKGGVIKITPIKANAAGGKYLYAIVKPSGEVVEYFTTKTAANEALGFWSRRLKLRLAVKRESK